MSGKQHEEETNFYGVQTDEEVKKQFEELQYRDELKRPKIMEYIYMVLRDNTEIQK